MSTLLYIPIALLICDKALVKPPAASAVNDNCISYSPCIRYKSTSSAAHEQLTTEYQNCKQIPQYSENKSVSFQHSIKKQRHSSHINFCYTFYPRDAMLARVIGIATCLSVCLSVTRRYCVKTKKASGMISSPSDSPKTLVL